MKKAKRIVVVLLVVVLLAGAYISYGLFWPASTATAPAAAVVSIPNGISLLGTAEYLAQEGLLRPSAKLSFIAAGLATGRGRRLQPGRYQLNREMTAWEILVLLNKGQIFTQRVTIPEGYRLERIGELLAAKGIGTKSQFIKLTNHKSDTFLTSFPKTGGSLEGYLFPDTYEVDSRQGQREIAQKMLARFEELVWEGEFNGIEDPVEMSLHEVVTLASLIEGEARLNEERAVIAGVLVNRLDANMPLQCDATVQYALGDHKTRLTYEDYKTPSPYNTYLHKGLPPGPINNPGLASIRAALRPAETPYYYYVAKPDGSHLFSRTYKEHLRAIARIRSQN